MFGRAAVRLFSPEGLQEALRSRLGRSEWAWRRNHW